MIFYFVNKLHNLTTFLIKWLNVSNNNTNSFTLFFSILNYLLGNSCGRCHFVSFIFNLLRSWLSYYHSATKTCSFAVVSTLPTFILSSFLRSSLFPHGVCTSIIYSLAYAYIYLFKVYVCICFFHDNWISYLPFHD